MEGYITPKQRFRTAFKTVFLLFVAVATLTGIGWFVNTYIYQFMASTDPVSVGVITSKPEIDLTENAQEEFEVVFQLTDRVISGVQFALIYDAKYLNYQEFKGATGIEVVYEDATITEDGSQGKVFFVFTDISEPDGTGAPLQTALLLPFSFSAQRGADEDMVESVIQQVALVPEEAEYVGIAEDGSATSFAPPADPVIASITIIRSSIQPVPSTTITPELSVSPEPSDEPSPTIEVETTLTPEPTNELISASPTLTPIITGTPSPSASPTPTIFPAQPTQTPIPTSAITRPPNGAAGTASLDITLRFQGVVREPMSSMRRLNVKLLLRDGSGRLQEQIVPFTVGTNGLWTGQMNNVVLASAQTYTIQIKGEKHLLRKICDMRPAESVAGTYKCTGEGMRLAAGQNTLDFSGTYFLAGDIPIQDGIVDAKDIVFIRQSFGSTNPATLLRGDLNLDGIIDTQDYSLVMAALAFKYDEE